MVRKFPFESESFFNKSKFRILWNRNTSGVVNIFQAW